jgi:hypothetical protein
MPDATPRPASLNDRTSSIKNVNDGVRGILGVAGDMFADRPGFIAGGGGTWPLADAVRAVSQFNCRQWARADKSGFSARVNAGNSALCNPYLSSIGMLPGEGDATLAYPAGKCAVIYNQYFEIPVFGGGYGETSPEQLLGPIVSRTQSDIGNATIRFVIANAAGQTATRELSGAFGLPPRFGRLVRNDGQADNCGNPDVTYQPPGSVTGGPTDGPNISVNIPGIGPIDVTVTPNSDGDPVVCYDQIDLCVTIPIGGDDGPKATAGADPGVPAVGTATTASGSGDAEGDAPEGRELWALKIGINSLPARANEYAPGVYRGVCYVYMGDGNGLDHDPAGAMLRSGQLVLAEKEGLTKYRVTANIGYNLTVTPYWRTPRKES